MVSGVLESMDLESFSACVDVGEVVYGVEVLFNDVKVRGAFMLFT